MDAVALALGLLLPWALGVAALAAARARTAAVTAGDFAWSLGAGYLVGAFALTVWMRVLAALGVAFGVAVVAAPLALATVALAVVAHRRGGRAWPAAADALRALVASPGLTGGARLLWWLLVALLALRFALLALAVNWQPLYPWDAWLQWGTKARVWFELRQMAPFALPDAWFAANGAAYFDAAPHYPPTVPLLQVWANLALGHWDDARMNWPWWQIAVALSLACYGGLARVGASPLQALFGAFAVATLPLANAHVALAGYADLPLAAYYTTAALALLAWGAHGERRDAAVAVVLAFACTQIKNPGWFWALTLLPGVVVLRMPLRGWKLVAGGIALALVAVVALARAQITVFNYRLHLDFDPAWPALAESYLLLGNWNLLWYAALGVAILGGRRLVALPLAPLTAVVLCGAVFLFVAFGFTNARAWVADQSTVNRATLHLAPLVACFVVLGFRAFSERWRAGRVSGPAAGDAVGQ